MAIKTVENYKYRDTAIEYSPHFEVTSIHMDTACVVNENKIAEYYRIYWIEEGYGEYRIDFKSFTIENAGLFFLSPGQVLQVDAEKVKSGYQISFDKEFYCVETHGKEIACNGVLFNNVHRATMISLQAADAPMFWQLIQNMMNELQNPGQAHREILETYLRMFLIEALRKLDRNQQQVEDKEENKLVADFIALVEKHHAQKHGVAEYAQMLAIAPKSLTKRLQAEGYPTPTQVIRDRIVLQAKRDLRYTDKSVKEIAFDLGFDDPAYFTRYFKKAEGVSPNGYKERVL